MLEQTENYPETLLMQWSNKSSDYKGKIAEWWRGKKHAADYANIEKEVTIARYRFDKMITVKATKTITIEEHNIYIRQN